MMKRSLVFISTIFLPACFFGAPTEVVYYPASTEKTTVIIEEEPPSPPHHSHYTATEVVVVEEYVCDPFLEDYYTPYYHTPEYCTDYGPGVGYCCTWSFGHGECMSEWCFWEDVCEWEHTWDECYHDEYYYY